MAASDRDLPDRTSARYVDQLLRADQGLMAAFWDDAQPPGVNYENIAYWLAQSSASQAPIGGKVNAARLAAASAKPSEAPASTSVG